MQRVRQYPDDGRFVATHALHLLCNKLGFSLGEEHEAFATLARLADSAVKADTATTYTGFTARPANLSNIGRAL